VLSPVFVNHRQATKSVGLLQLHVLSLGFFQDGNVGVGVLPAYDYATAADTRSTDFAGASTITATPMMTTHSKVYAAHIEDER
jgi:hypothetical protein